MPRRAELPRACCAAAAAISAGPPPGCLDASRVTLEEIRAALSCPVPAAEKRNSRRLLRWARSSRCCRSARNRTAAAAGRRACVLHGDVALLKQARAAAAGAAAAAAAGQHALIGLYSSSCWRACIIFCASTCRICHASALAVHQ